MKWKLLLTVLAATLAGCGGAAEPGAGAAAAAAAAAPAEGMPPGFTLSVFADELNKARFLEFGPDGTLYVGTNSDEVWAVRDEDGDGRADRKVVFLGGLRVPHSVYWHDPDGDGGPSASLGTGWLYIGETHRVIRARDTDGDLQADEQEVVVRGLPPGEQHFTRTVGFGPEGYLYVSVGSTCNVCEEDDPRRAAIVRYNPDGSGEEIYARGLRNSVGIAWHPQSGEMWAVNNGRDWLGDDLPPEELNRIVRGGHYGWPYCYSDRVPDPDMGSKEQCRDTIPPAFEMQAHSAPLGMEFYTGEMFPAEYKHDLFVAFHGSWNRSVPTGYKVVRIRFEDGRPVALEDFVDVWLKGGRAQHRPVDVETGPDGALYISDDRGDTVFRVTYQKP